MLIPFTGWPASVMGVKMVDPFIKKQRKNAPDAGRYFWRIILKFCGFVPTSWI
jgi:hypothetical protein